jgi:MFS family permease
VGGARHPRPLPQRLLADVVEPGAYGRAYGFERAMDNFGAIVGPLLALVLVSFVGVRTAILWSIVPGLLAAVAIFYAAGTSSDRPRASTASTS